MKLRYTLSSGYFDTITLLSSFLFALPFPQMSLLTVLGAWLTTVNPLSLPNSLYLIYKDVQDSSVAIVAEESFFNNQELMKSAMDEVSLLIGHSAYVVLSGLK